MENQKSILIVDDQEVGRSLLESILYKENFNLLFASDGEEAFNQTKTHKPDLILLDVMMPKSDGYETCSRIRADHEIRETPIILVTALDDRDSRIRGFEAGANDYISKPIDRSELLARSKNLINLHEYKHLLDQKSHGIQTVPVTETETISSDGTDVLLQKMGVSPSTLFTEYYKFAPDTVADPFIFGVFYQKLGIIYALFCEMPVHQELVSAFQDALLHENPSFDTIRSYAQHHNYLIIKIDRLQHNIHGWSNGMSGVVFGNNRIENIFTSTTEEIQNYNIEDALVVGLKTHLEKLFESGISMQFLKETASIHLNDVLFELKQNLKGTETEFTLFKIG